MNVIDGCIAIDQATKLFGLGDSVKSGVVFSTYSTLVSSTATGMFKSLVQSLTINLNNSQIHSQTSLSIMTIQ